MHIVYIFYTHCKVVVYLCLELYYKVHQTWLEYGPSAANLRDANADVRQCLSDMGVEFGIANYPDIVDDYLGSKNILPNSRDFLYPFAMQVPGLLHITDWALRQTVEQLGFWVLWQGQAKAICQYTHGRNHRDHMVEVIQAHVKDDEVLGNCKKSLKTATGRFANWRWKTLQGAVKDLLRVKAALCIVMSLVDTGEADLGIRDAPKAAKIKSAVLEPTFWEHCRAILFVINPLMKFSGWCQGCDCHEAELLNGKVIECTFKGCRARNLSNQINIVKTEITHNRSTLHAQDFDQYIAQTVMQSLTVSIAGFDLKLRWVNRLPYLIWQVPGTSTRNILHNVS
jgi:hypothetical protein